MGMGFKVLILYSCLLGILAQAEEINIHENLFAKTNLQNELREEAVRIETSTNNDPSNDPAHDPTAVLYLLSASGKRLPVHFVEPSDRKKVSFVFIGGLDSDIDSFKKIEDGLIPLGYGSIRIELKGQGRLVSNSPLIEPIQVSDQAKDLISVLNQLNIDKSRMALVGYSYGASVSIQTAIYLHETAPEKIASLDLINPLLQDENYGTDFSSVFIRLKNISGPTPSRELPPIELLKQLSLSGEFASQTDGAFNLAEVTSAYNLFSGLSNDLADSLLSINTKVNFFDGLADLVLPAIDKTNLFERVLIRNRGSYYRAEGVSHRAPEESPAEVIRFLVEANP